MNAKAYKLEVYVLDVHGHSKKDDILMMIDNSDYHDLHMRVINCQVRDAGKWHDDHPLNKKDTWRQTYLKLFNEEQNTKLEFKSQNSNSGGLLMIGLEDE